MADRPLGAAAVILDDVGRVLLVNHTYGKLNWEVPGGYSEPGESALETVLREVRQETGLAVVVERLTGVYDDPEHDTHHFVMLCHQQEQTEVPRADLSEVSTLDYWPVDALPRPISDFTARRIQDALAETASQHLP